ncbi:DUF1836 domain-containing protein [Eubacterium sp. AF36-5BH]|mgnify:FL=1|jgi:hypothetical protein|uniref:DUF1836 domain-containing protein n=1 Tax=Eubacterium sp. AF36-5BH TaxID=2293108 RepID=UPI000E4A8D3D|nr:DUF1836 domain-containing protein [Eubacterium sp. AF36-5BH]RGF52890.1 DUF1836 domain-containing protein [Eubacterium sp. AF36-5BH]
MHSEDFIKKILDDIDTFNIDDIPNIDLYMDQVTTYLNDKFANTKRHEDDKLMTKTMINNYVKSRLLPSPEKKKYTKDHMMVLVMIYFFKNIISINDVNKLITPLLDSYFHNEEIPLENIINTFLTFAKQCNLTDTILTEYNECREIFKDADVKDKEYLETMGLITMLSYDTFVRKIVIEKLIDSLPDTENTEK